MCHAHKNSQMHVNVIIIGPIIVSKGDNLSKKSTKRYNDCSVISYTCHNKLI